jgi:hypothetical protein
MPTTQAKRPRGPQIHCYLSRTQRREVNKMADALSEKLNVQANDATVVRHALKLLGDSLGISFTPYQRSARSRAAQKPRPAQPGQGEP